LIVSILCAKNGDGALFVVVSFFLVLLILEEKARKKEGAGMEEKARK